MVLLLLVASLTTTPLERCRELFDLGLRVVCSYFLHIHDLVPARRWRACTFYHPKDVSCLDNKQEQSGGWGNSCYLNNFATISLVVLLTIPYFLQKIIFDLIYICYYSYVLIKFISCIDINDVAGNLSIGMHIGLFFSCNQFNVN